MMKVLSQGQKAFSRAGALCRFRGYSRSCIPNSIWDSRSPARRRMVPLRYLEGTWLAGWETWPIRCGPAMPCPAAVPLVRLSPPLHARFRNSRPGGDRYELDGAASLLQRRYTKRVATVAASLFPAPLSEEPAVLRRWLNRVGPEHFADIARAWLAGARAHEKLERAPPERKDGPPTDGSPEDASPREVVRRINALRDDSP